MKKIFLFLLLTSFAAFTLAQSPEELSAMSLFQNGKKAEAASAFEKIISTNPSNLSAINALGFIYLESGRNKEAYDISSKGLSINKNDDNLSITKARAAIKIGKSDEAIILMDACINRDATFFMPYYIKGNAFDAQEKIQLAIGMYNKAIQLNADFPNVYLDRGNDFVSMSRYQQAIADYDKTLVLEPESNEAYNMRGIAYYRIEKYDNAIADYTKSIELGNYFALVNRGVLYKDQKKIDLAKADFNKAISINANIAEDAYFNLAEVLSNEENYEEALINIEKALKLNSNASHYYALYANVLLNLKKDNEGLAAAEKSLLLDNKNRDAFIYKTTALNNLKRFDDAIKTITQGIVEYPDYYLMYSLRAFIYKRIGKTDLAEADIAKAKQLGLKD